PDPLLLRAGTRRVQHRERQLWAPSLDVTEPWREVLHGVRGDHRQSDRRHPARSTQRVAISRAASTWSNTSARRAATAGADDSSNTAGSMDAGSKGVRINSPSSRQIESPCMAAGRFWSYAMSRIDGARP